MEDKREALGLPDMRCTGCGACANVCPTDAILLCPDPLGFFRPEVDPQKCINCGKCVRTCPVYVDGCAEHAAQPECYAVMAEDSVRIRSSSGGAFFALAKAVLNMGGAVCGAELTPNLSVRHILIDSAEDLPKLQKSKYVQSEIGTIYRQIAGRLSKGQKVLFSGTPCQVAGLYGFLGRTDENLWSVDVICHGISSWQMLKDSLCGEEEVAKIVFRDKAYGWEGLGMTLVYQDGSKKRLTYDESRFEQGFHPNIILNESCYSCPFCTFPRRGDLSMGDFWGIDNFFPELNDQKGTSAVLINSEHGKKLWEKARTHLRLVRKVSVDCLGHNRIQADIKKPMERARFLSLYPQREFNQAVLYAQQNMHDIGIVGNWSYPNYGTALTYYALYVVLKEMGYSVVMLSWPKDSPWQPYEAPALFKVTPYAQWDIAEIPEERSGLWEYNDRCGMFVLGSDQLLNNNLYQNFSRFVQMDWVKSNRRKIAYATSFGTDHIWGSDDDRAELAHFLQQFDAVSVREPSGKRILTEKFGVASEAVLDPVFLMPKEHYQELIQKGEPAETPGNYLFAYLLDGDDQTWSILNACGQDIGLPVLAATDAAPAEHQIIQEHAAMEIKEVSYVEDWLSHIANCDFLITDSFHGTCMAIILHKPFLSICNAERGAVRFRDLLAQLGLEDRLCASVAELPDKISLLTKKIDFDRVEERLTKLREASLSWLKKALTQEQAVTQLSDYDLLVQQTNVLRRDVERTDALQWEQLEDHKKRLDGLDAKAEESVKADALQWEQLADHKKRLDGLDAKTDETEKTDAAQWEQLEDHRKRLDGLDVKTDEAVKTDALQWEQLEDHKKRLDGLDTKTDEAAKAGASQWEQLEDHRKRLDGIDEKVAEAEKISIDQGEQLKSLEQRFLDLQRDNEELREHLEQLEKFSPIFRLIRKLRNKWRARRGKG